MARREVTIRGVTYPSFSQAAKALGVCRQTVSIAVSEGREATVGNGHHGQPVRIRGVDYVSIRQAATALNLSYKAVQTALDAGVPDSAGIMPVGYRRASLHTFNVEAVSVLDGRYVRIATLLAPKASFAIEAYLRVAPAQASIVYELSTIRAHKGS